MWTQIVGKIRLALTPWTNHSWHVTLYLTSRALTTSPIAHGSRTPPLLRWGSVDRAVARCSGRRAPQHPGGVPHLPDAVTREAYSHEVSSLGFWPGNEMMPDPIFYSYAYPAPDGFPEAKVRPAFASYNAQLKEFVLPYEQMRRSESPDAALLDFARSTYDAASTLGDWDRAALTEVKPHLHSRPHRS